MPTKIRRELYGQLVDEYDIDDAEWHAIDCRCTECIAGLLAARQERSDDAA